ncbi:hypothetical protein ACEYW6_36455 [Nostoc sp. UIC 10607]
MAILLRNFIGLQAYLLFSLSSLTELVRLSSVQILTGCCIREAVSAIANS